MKSSVWPQILIGVVFAFILSVLFLKSQVNYLQHADNLVDVQVLQRLDSELESQMLQLRTGDVKNFDSLVVLARDIRQQLEKLQRLSEQFASGHSIASDSIFLTEDYAEKLVLLEHFKQRIALLQLMKRSFPVASRKFDVRLATHTFVSKTDKKFYRNRMRRLLNEVSFYVSGGIDNATKIDTLVRVLLKDTFKMPKDLQADYLQLLRYSSRLLTYTSVLGDIGRDLAETGTRQSIIDYRLAYINAFQESQKVAGRYRVAMFLAAIALLIYLLNLFLRLQSATTRLNKTLGRLEFQNFATDEHAIVSITDVKGNITYANDKFCEVSKYTRAELIGQNHRIIKSHHHSTGVFREMWRTIARGDVWHGVLCNLDKYGGEYWVDSTVVPHLNEQGKPDQYISIRTDITAQVLAEQDVALLARFPEENPEPVLRIDHYGELLFANHAAQDMLLKWGILKPGIAKQSLQAVVSEALETDVKSEVELRISDTDYVITYTPVVDEDYVNVYAKDVTARKRAEEKLLYQANHDPLTGLYNRNSFDDELEKVLADSYNEHPSILLYLDLDQFKVVNDTCGHVAGDELLRQLTTELLVITRDSDVVARLGGDEFGIILKHCALERGEQVARKIHQAIRDYRFSWQDKSFDVGASLGLVVIDGGIGNTSDLLRVADVACYTAKDRGRDQIHVYNADDAETSERQAEMHWASIIPAALSENRFLLMAQDIVPLNEQGNLHKHYEILVRMLDEGGGIIPPGAFIPAAERYSLMPAIDHWVVRNVIDTLVVAKRQYGESPVRHVAINLSGESMNKLDLLRFIGDQIALHPFLAHTLSFEVTETAAISNLSAAVHFINELKEFGCEFSLDDFGSGLSSFGYLKNLPVDYLKIDGAFVKDILDDPIDEAMVQAINQIGHVMNIKTIAEFVETDEIAARLKAIGVDFAQGFGIARPILLDEVIRRDAVLLEKAV